MLKHNLDLPRLGLRAAVIEKWPGDVFSVKDSIWYDGPDTQVYYVVALRSGQSVENAPWPIAQLVSLADTKTGAGAQPVEFPVGPFSGGIPADAWQKSLDATRFLVLRSKWEAAGGKMDTPANKKKLWDARSDDETTDSVYQTWPKYAPVVAFERPADGAELPVSNNISIKFTASYTDKGGVARTLATACSLKYQYAAPDFLGMFGPETPIGHAAGFKEFTPAQGAGTYRFLADLPEGADYQGAAAAVTVTLRETTMDQPPLLAADAIWS